MFRLESEWVWDFWIADDGETFHLFHLRAPQSLGDPDLRHRHARIGHATSRDLREWTDHGVVLGPGGPGGADETATWTGCVVRGDDGLWRMFYTGTVFLDPGSNRNVESVLMATSPDLTEWDKRDGFVLTAAGELYEKLGDSVWTDEAWRDPWVFRDPQGNGWHMLVTARARGAEQSSGGVVGHAWSPDLDTWTAQPHLGAVSTRFPHLEVLQTVEAAGEHLTLFCATRSDGVDGVWGMPTGPVPDDARPDDARLLAPAPAYAGRVVRDRDGVPVLLAFTRDAAGAPLGVADPVDLEALWHGAAHLG
ncbi:glycosyl hydrolase family 32 [Microbacterium sp. NPDC077663]|uniref:glycosyl hydrolase family 32 n=1 Tax=Microbacterium sp. NPDC077663 TaxID=3364189 RepID=UPI0037C9132F